MFDINISTSTSPLPISPIRPDHINIHATGNQKNTSVRQTLELYQTVNSINAEISPCKDSEHLTGRPGRANIIS